MLRSGRLRTDLYYRMRHLVHFPSLHARFSDRETCRLTLKVLLKTYRWRLAPVIAQATARAGDIRESVGDELTKARLRAMFPELEEEAAARLLEPLWPSNLRELEGWRATCSATPTATRAGYWPVTGGQCPWLVRNTWGTGHQHGGRSHPGAPHPAGGCRRRPARERVRHRAHDPQPEKIPSDASPALEAVTKAVPQAGKGKAEQGRE